MRKMKASNHARGEEKATKNKYSIRPRKRSI